MSTVKDKVASIFERLKTGVLSRIETSPQSGWGISLPSSRTVTRSTLQAEARPIIALGLEVVPELLPWVMNEYPALRDVAIYALEQITGKTSTFHILLTRTTRDTGVFGSIWTRVG